MSSVDGDDDTSYSFKVKETKALIPMTTFIDDWRVPSDCARPEDPDPEKTLYGEQKQIMVMTCEDFDDLVRLNQQERVAIKYTTMLRESASVKYGLKFLSNFRILNKLLYLLENIIRSFQQGEPSQLREINSNLDYINRQLAQFFRIYPISKKERPTPSHVIPVHHIRMNCYQCSRNAVYLYQNNAEPFRNDVHRSHGMSGVCVDHKYWADKISTWVYCGMNPQDTLDDSLIESFDLLSVRNHL